MEERDVPARLALKFDLILFLAIACTAVAFILSSCSALPVIGSVTTIPQADNSKMPTTLVRYDGDVFVAWAQTYVDAEVFARDSGGVLMGPVTVPAGYAIVHVRSKHLKWTEKMPAALPLEARPLFRESEVLAWGLLFRQPEP